MIADGRTAAITPLASKVQGFDLLNPESKEKSLEELTMWLSKLREVLDLPGLGQVSFARNGWQRGRGLLNEQLAEGLQSDLSSRYSGPQGDVEVLDIQVTRETTQEVLLKLQIYDASDYGDGRQGTRALTIGKSGKRIAAISGVQGAPERAAILGQKEILLRGFSGYTFRRGPETMDNRGAAFSPSESLLAICERSNVIGFWRTENGEFVGRVIFDPAAHGCIVDGATGLPSTFTALSSNEHDGWTFELPV